MMDHKGIDEAMRHPTGDHPHFDTIKKIILAALGAYHNTNVENRFGISPLIDRMEVLEQKAAMDLLDNKKRFQERDERIAALESIHPKDIYESKRRLDAQSPPGPCCQYSRMLQDGCIPNLTQVYQICGKCMLNIEP